MNDNALQQRMHLIEQTALTHRGATKDFKVEWNATRYQVGGKLFAMVGENKENESILTVKLEPSKAAELVRIYPFVTPGYYMNKRHWISILLGYDVPRAFLEEVLHESYQLVYGALPKRQQMQLSSTPND